jgi:major type 1 subunit fimbrin (pilin)
MGQVLGPSIPLQVLSNTCTLTTPANQALSLPAVSTSAFQGIGTTAGARQFTIAYNCTTPAGAMQVSMAWLFTAVGQGPSNYAVIQNTGTAGGIGVQLSDRSGNSFVTGVPSPQASLAANGTQTLSFTYFAKYYQFGTTVTPGTVNATAQYTMTYQ